MADMLPTIDAVVEKYCISNNKIKSFVYQSLGLIFTIFAFIGIFVPRWPTVSWAVPAAFLFSLSNERLFRWSLNNRFLAQNSLITMQQVRPYHGTLNSSLWGWLA